MVLATGASLGIGASIAIKFAVQGAHVSKVGRNEEKLKKVAEKHGEPLVIRVDISKVEYAKRIVNKTVEQFGELDVLMTNAGITGVASTTDKHALGSLETLQHDTLLRPKSDIINISSIADTRTIAQENFAYCASKAAFNHFMRSIAIDLASEGVR